MFQKSGYVHWSQKIWVLLQNEYYWNEGTRVCVFINWIYVEFKTLTIDNSNASRGIVPFKKALMNDYEAD